MRSVPVGQARHPSGVPVEMGEVNVVRVLFRVDAHDADQQALVLFIDPVHRAHQPGTGGQGFSRPARARFETVQVVPAGPLGHPDHFAPVLQPLEVGLL